MAYQSLFNAKFCLYIHIYIKHDVVLGWMISLSVEPGIEPGTFGFQSKVLADFLLHHFPLCVPPSLPHSPFLSLSLSLSVLLLSFLFYLFSCFSFSLLLAEKLTQKKRTSRHRRNWSVFIHATLPIIHFLSL